MHNALLSSQLLPHLLHNVFFFFFFQLPAAEIQKGKMPGAERANSLLLNHPHPSAFACTKCSRVYASTIGLYVQQWACKIEVTINIPGSSSARNQPSNRPIALSLRGFYYRPVALSLYVCTDEKVAHVTDRNTSSKLTGYYILFRNKNVYLLLFCFGHQTLYGALLQRDQARPHAARHTTQLLVTNNVFKFSPPPPRLSMFPRSV